MKKRTKELHGREDANEANLSITNKGRRKPIAGNYIYAPSVHDSRRVHLQGPRDGEPHQLMISYADLCCSSFESRHQVWLGL